MRPARSARQQVRIIGGKWKGRKLRVPAGVRPTPDRAKVTVFNWLGARLPGARVLDAFAGTGALGFEALSRGAAWATFVESRAETARKLREQGAALGADNITLARAQTPAWLAGQPEHVRWDVVFVDPPFAANLLAATLRALTPLLAEGSVVYAQASLREDLAALAPPGFTVARASTAGAARYGLLEWHGSPEDSP